MERPSLTLPQVLDRLRDVLQTSEYENRVFLVGGYVRDKLLGTPQTQADDIDLVLEGDALALARFLHTRRVASRPVVFEAFGTAMVKMGDVQIEMVTARAETYRHGSRKPVVTPGTLQTDANRRDFTVNTFLENLHTGEILDPTGKGYDDLATRVLRTPLDPDITFSDDPLRMLRACRFAAKLDFAIAPETWAALLKNAFRCTPDYGIAYERVREEFNKTLMTARAAQGLKRMLDAGLLSLFAPELVQMHGVTQNRFHLYDVWGHTLVALSNLPPDAPLVVRLATLFHDIGKPDTRTQDADGNVHFYGHEDTGAEITRTVLSRLKYSNEEIRAVTTRVALHMRYGAYTPDWTDAAVRRLIRSVDEARDDLFTIAHADIAACNTEDFPTADLIGLRERMERIEATAHITTATAPLTGTEIIALGVTAGPQVGIIKAQLTDAVVSGEMAPDDKDEAARRVRAFLDQNVGAFRPNQYI